MSKHLKTLFSLNTRTFNHSSAIDPNITIDSLEFAHTLQQEPNIQSGKFHVDMLTLECKIENYKKWYLLYMGDTDIILPAENWICCQYTTHWLACPHVTQLNVQNAQHVQALHMCSNEDIKCSYMGDSVTIKRNKIHNNIKYYFVVWYITSSGMKTILKVYKIRKHFKTKNSSTQINKMKKRIKNIEDLGECYHYYSIYFVTKIVLLNYDQAFLKKEIIFFVGGGYSWFIFPTKCHWFCLQVIEIHTAKGIGSFFNKGTLP